METELKTEMSSPNLDELFKSLGECMYLYIKTQTYLESLKAQRTLILEQIENTYNGEYSKNLVEQEGL